MVSSRMVGYGSSQPGLSCHNILSQHHQCQAYESETQCISICHVPSQITAQNRILDFSSQPDVFVPQSLPLQLLKQKPQILSLISLFASFSYPLHELCFQRHLSLISSFLCHQSQSFPLLSPLSHYHLSIELMQQSLESCCRDNDLSNTLLRSYYSSL